MTGTGDGTAPLVTLTGVGKRFASGTQALACVDLAVGPHEFLSLVGPSGCGKSTILRLIAGISAPSDGAIDWAPGSGGHEAAAIGFVFQEPTLMPWARVMANVTLPLRLGGTRRTEAEAAARPVLEMVGLEGFERAFPRELSGGMKMRVSIARALVTRPRLLLMDEPFAALDEITRLKLNDELLALWRAHRWTVVFVTHSVFEATYLSTRVAVISPRPGRVAAEIAVEGPESRAAGYRFDPRYAAACAAIQAALGEGAR